MEFDLDKRRVRAAFERAAATYDASAVLQRTVADRLLERLEVIKLAPARVLDVGSGTGYGTRLLKKRYRRAQVLGVDLAHSLLKRAVANAGWFGRTPLICGDAEALPVADQSVDMIVSNLTLQWCRPDVVFREFVRVLRPGGMLMFTSFGPDTLRELRSAWRTVDAQPHVHTFIDMHDVGDALIRAGFSDPVMDVEHFTLTYNDVTAVLRDLKDIGAHHAGKARVHGLTGKDRFRRFEAAYEQLRRDGKIPATFEVVYGHAWAPAQPPSSYRRPDGAVAIPLSRLKRRS